MTGATVAVTGATGFVGRRLVPVLAAAGWRVKVLVRRRCDPRFWGETAVEPIVGDLGDAPSLSNLVAGTDLVIHAAGAIKARDRQAFFAVNAEGARAVAEAAGGRRMILLSSQVAREPGLSDYAASKRAGEDLVRMVMAEGLTILRPPAVYGPGDQETLALFRLAQTLSLLPLPGGPMARVALAHVDDVAAEIRYLCEVNPGPGPYVVAGHRPEGYDWRHIMMAAGVAVGRKPVLIPTPPGLLRALGGLTHAVARLTGRPAIFTAGKAAEFLHADWSVANHERTPGAPEARFTLEQGFADTVAWYRRNRWLAEAGRSAPG